MKVKKFDLLASDGYSVYPYITKYMIEYRSRIMSYFGDLLPFAFKSDLRENIIQWQPFSPVRFGIPFHFGIVHKSSKEIKERSKVKIEESIFKSKIKKIGTISLDKDGDVTVETSEEYLNYDNAYVRNFGDNLRYDYLDYLSIKHEWIGTVSRNNTLYAILDLQHAYFKVEHYFPQWLFTHYLPKSKEKQCGSCQNSIPGIFFLFTFFLYFC